MRLEPARFHVSELVPFPPIWIEHREQPVPLAMLQAHDAGPLQLAGTQRFQLAVNSDGRQRWRHGLPGA
jgi:hypothetical protein